MQQIASKGEGKFEVIYVDVDKFKQIAELFQVKSIPQIFFVKDGETEHLFNGMKMEDEIQDIIDSKL